MSENIMKVWNNDSAQQLAAALTAIDEQSTMQSFLRDVMTEKEIAEISTRLKAARMLRAGQKYTDIVSKTKTSSRTVARISAWLQNGSGGYATILNQSNQHQNHISPVRAE